jgi:hypothetical protein
MEYKAVANMRLRHLAAESRRPDQLTVLVRNVPPDPDESVNEHVEHFFCVNHPDHYLCHQVRFFSWLKVNSSTISRKPLIEWYSELFSFFT